MTTMNIETDLIALNEKSVPVEQAGGPEAITFFDALLSSELIFRRASGKVVGKGGDDGFMEALKNNPFEKRVLERDIEVDVVGDRALVRLIIAATRKDDHA